MRDISVADALELTFYSAELEYEISIKEYLKKILKNTWFEGQPAITSKSSLMRIFCSAKEYVNDVVNVNVFNIHSYRTELLEALLELDLLPEHCIKITPEGKRFVDDNDSYANQIVRTLISFI